MFSPEKRIRLTALMALGVLTSVACSEGGNVYGQSTQQTQDRLGDRTNISPGTSILSAAVNLPSIDNSVKGEFDYSGWKTFSSGLTLKYPPQKGWESEGNHLLLFEPNGNVPVYMTTWIDSLKNTTFEAYVREQYDLAAVIDRKNPFAVVSQPANLPGLKEAGLRGEVLAYQKQPGPGQLSYNERHFMIESRDQVINWVIDERPSSIDYNVMVDLMLKSARFGIQK